MNDAVIKGTIVATGAQSVQLKVLEVLHGAETRSVVTIWDGTDFTCSMFFSMKASGMGNAGDTLLTILPLITTTVNSWDVPGDYRRPYYLFYEVVMPVKRDTIIGLINSNYSAQPPYWSVSKMSYSDFRNYWLAHQNDCQTLVGIDDNNGDVVNNLIIENDILKICCANAESCSIGIYTLEGSTIFERKNARSGGYALEALAPGIYIVRVMYSGGQLINKKMMLRH